MSNDVAVAEDEIIDPEVLKDDNTVQLRKPLANGISSLTFHFDSLTGGTLIKCQAKARKLDPGMTVAMLSDAYLALVAAAALGIKYDEVINLTAPDFAAVTIRVQSFLAGNR